MCSAPRGARPRGRRRECQRPFSAPSPAPWSREGSPRRQSGLRRGLALESGSFLPGRGRRPRRGGCGAGHSSLPRHRRRRGDLGALAVGLRLVGSAGSRLLRMRTSSPRLLWGDLLRPQGSPGGPGRTLARERERSSLSPLPGALPWLKAGAGPSLFLLKRTRVQRRGPRSVFSLTWQHYQLLSGGPCPLHAGKYDSDRAMRIVRADTRLMHASPASGPTVGRRFGGVRAGQTPRSWRDGAEPAPAFASTRQLLPERRRVLGPGRGAGDKQASPCPQRAGSSRPRLLVLCTLFPRISFTLVPRESPLSPQHLP